jgi:hypothetical protein
VAISTLDNLIGASKVIAPGNKTATRTTVAGGWFSLFDVAGSLTGVLAGGQTSPPANTAGAVPTDAIAGYPNIPWSSLRTYLSRLTVTNTVASVWRLFDRVWVGGTYAFNANVAVTSPSWASRVSYNGGSADYSGLEIWAETVTVATGNQTWNVSYTDQGGVAGLTGAVGIGAAPSVGRCWQLPLAAGDSGLQAITNVTGGTGSAGTANIMVLRPLVDIYLPANVPMTLNWADLGLPEIFNDSALYWLTQAPSGTSSGTVSPITYQFSNG